jgi:hypothetical protein
MPRAFNRYPSKPAAGDRVAIVSPSSGLSGNLPLPYELGLKRLRDELCLVPVEHPTTRQMNATSPPEQQHARRGTAPGAPSGPRVPTLVRS